MLHVDVVFLWFICDFWKFLPFWNILNFDCSGEEFLCLTCYPDWLKCWLKRLKKIYSMVCLLVFLYFSLFNFFYYAALLFRVENFFLSVNGIGNLFNYKVFFSFFFFFNQRGRIEDVVVCRKYRKKNLGKM